MRKRKKLNLKEICIMGTIKKWLATLMCVLVLGNFVVSYNPVHVRITGVDIVEQDTEIG